VYIFYSGQGDCYASVGVSKRKGKETSVETVYLGRVLDRDKGIYKSRERGIFTFNLATGEFGSVDEAYVAPKQVDGRQRCPRVCVDFGDVFFLDSYLRISGMRAVVDSLEYGNRDTLHAMLLFYILSSLANCDAVHWYEGSAVRLLYPDANLTSQRISDFLAAIGTPEKRMAFQKTYIGHIKEHYDADNNILVDSTGLPNNIHFSMTATNVHNGKVSNEVRLIFVVQRSTGLPLYFLPVPGNIVDVSTLSRIFLHLDSMGINISSCLMDAGYNSGDNLDLFYNEDHTSRIGFITRVCSGDKTFRELVARELPGIDRKENFVRYEDRYLFIVRQPVMVGSRKDNPAWMYLGLDCCRMSDEQHKLLKRAVRDALSMDEVYEALLNGGVFGILSDKEYPCEEILPAYYQRQAAEQIFDIAKNYTKLLPLRTNSEATFNGHLLLSYIAACVMKMVQMRMQSANLFFGSRLACLRNQKCTIYPNRLVTDVPQRDANDTYKAFGIMCPDSIQIVEGRLQLPSDADAASKQKDTASKQKGTAKRTASSPKARFPTENKTLEKNPATERKEEVRRGRGRPKGSKNKKTLLREGMEKALTPKRKPGRPKGAKNKKTLLCEEMEKALTTKRKPGRPKGAKNKKTLLREEMEAVAARKIKRCPGRPKGSKNRKLLK